MLKLSMMGPLRCEWGSKEVQINARKASGLLVYLSIHRHQHQRDALAYLLWPEVSTQRARSSLSRSLTILRKALGTQALETDRDTVAIASSLSLSCDWHQCKQAVLGCDDHQHTPDLTCPLCQQLAFDAVELVHGPLLQGFSVPQATAFDEWLEGMREEAQGLTLQLFTWCIQKLEQEAEIPQTIQLARRLQLLHPLHEPTIRTLLRLYAARQQETEAHQLYQRLSQSLARTWAIAPESATTQLYESIYLQSSSTTHQTPDSTQRVSSARHAPGIALSLHTQSPPKAQREPLLVQPTLPIQPIEQAQEVSASQEHSLPSLAAAGRTPFVGRESELLALRKQCKDRSHTSHRLINLVGPGGIGKTRLALQAGERLQDLFPHGIWFVPLESIYDAEHVWPALAESLGYFPQPGGSLQEQLLAYIKHKPLLFILDNIEQVQGIDKLIRQCLQCTIAPTFLVTSREKLRIAEEWLFVLEGLPCPGHGEPPDPSHHSAIAFFLQCGQRINAHLAPDATILEDVAWICRWVAGVPLCLELAASWLRVFSCRQIREALAQDDALLTSSFQDIPDRQQSQRHVFETSWSMLTPEEQMGFASLSVFEGGFTYQAAQTITAASLPMLRTWIDRFLLHREENGRFALHPLLRQYAAEKCAATGLSQRHAHYYLPWLRTQYNALWSPTQSTTLRAIEQEWSNLLSAWRWAVENDETTLLRHAHRPLAHAFQLRGWFREGHAHFAHTSARYSPETTHQDDDLSVWLVLHTTYFALMLHHRDDAISSLAQLPSSLPSPEVTAYHLYLLGLLAQQQSQHEEAKRHYKESLAGARIGELHSDAMQCLHALGDLACRNGEQETAQQYFVEGMEIARRLGASGALAEALNQLGTLAGIAGQYQLASERFQESHREYERIGSLFGRARTHNNQAILLHIQGRHEASYEMRQECLALCRDLGSQVDIARALSHLCTSARALGRFDEADQYALESLALGQEYQDLRVMVQALGTLTCNCISRQQWADAEAYLHQAMQYAHTLGLPPVALHLLATYTELQLAQGHTSKGWELYDYLQGHTQKETQTLSLLQTLHQEYAHTKPAAKATTSDKSADKHPRKDLTWQVMLNEILAQASPTKS